MKDLQKAVEKHQKLILDAERWLWAHPETGAVHACVHHAQGAALSLNNNVDIADFPGYAPLINNEEMIDVATEAAALMIPHQKFERDYQIGSGSTDMGDISAVIPVVHPYSGGRVGTGHGADNYTVDPVASCVDGAKWQLGMLYLLCENGGERAFNIKKNYKAPFASIPEYLEFMDSLEDSGDRIEYNDDGTATVRL